MRKRKRKLLKSLWRFFVTNVTAPTTSIISRVCGGDIEKTIVIAIQQTTQMTHWELRGFIVVNISNKYTISTKTGAID